MKDTKHKILTLAALTTIAAGVIHLTNRVIVASSQLKEMLDFSNHNYYNWRFGKIYYTKKGKGSPERLSRSQSLACRNVATRGGEYTL